MWIVMTGVTTLCVGGWYHGNISSDVMVWSHHQPKQRVSLTLTK